jgi:hypothetical protein
MAQVGYFNVEARRREKQEARDRDQHLIANGQLSAHQVSQQNGLFSALDPSQVRLVQRRAGIHRAA